jgi:site-specific recombinase XerD
MSVFTYLKDKNRTISSIYISVYCKGVRVRQSTKLKIETKYWDKKKNQLKNIVPGRYDLDKKLKTIESNCKDIVAKFNTENSYIDKEILTKEVKQIVDPKPSDANPTFVIEGMDRYIGERRQSKEFTEGTNKRYETTLNYLKEFLNYPKQNLLIDKVSEQTLSQFYSFLIDKPKIHNPYARRQLMNFRTFLDWCVKSGFLNHIKYKQYEIPKNINKFSSKADIRLYKNELAAIEDYTPLNQKMEHTKDLFLLHCYTGLRISDFFELGLKNIDLKNKVITSIAKKTSEKSEIPITDKALEILRKYQLKLPFPKGSSTKKFMTYNKNIRELCELCGIDQEIEVVEGKGANQDKNVYKKYELMSSHKARKTFISLLKEAGVPDHIIIIFTGQSKNTIKSYQNAEYTQAIDSFGSIIQKAI